MQGSCIGALMELAERDQNVIYLTADSGEGGLDLMFRRNFPDRSFDFGIAEENMVAAAAGLAASGKLPFVYTAAPFLAYRAFEFIRNDICLQSLNVKLIGTGSGITVSSLGPTHHTTEDIGVLRTLPGLTILSPASPLQVYACMREAYRISGPVYLRLGMGGEGEYFAEGYRLDGIKPELLRDGSDLLLAATGSILREVMEAAEILEKKGISARVVNIPVIKPFDAESICGLAEDVRLVCVAEEHNVLGGLGTVIAEAMQNRLMQRRLLKIGLEDSFSTGYGELRQVRRENGLDAETIAGRIMEAYDK